MKELSIYKKLLKEELAKRNSNEIKINYYNQCIHKLENEILDFFNNI